MRTLVKKVLKSLAMLALGIGLLVLSYNLFAWAILLPEGYPLHYLDEACLVLGGIFSFLLAIPALVYSLMMWGD
jgi:hypothetical protein